ncbi:hypothetical protein AVEN_15626-1, partial [Araneus ventricosus]
ALQNLTFSAPFLNVGARSSHVIISDSTQGLHDSKMSSLVLRSCRTVILLLGRGVTIDMEASIIILPLAIKGTILKM